MKPKSILVLALLFTSFSVHAQLTAKKKCEDFTVDVLNGKVNEFKANIGAEQLKAKFPCFSSAEEENNSSKCGGGVFFADKGITFFTGRDYVEINDKFKGKLSMPLMGAARNSFFQNIG